MSTTRPAPRADRPRRPARRRTAGGLALTLVLAGLSLSAGPGAPPASAAAPSSRCDAGTGTLVCTGTHAVPTVRRTAVRQADPAVPTVPTGRASVAVVRAARPGSRTATASTRGRAAAAPALTVVAATSPVAVARTGQRITYTVTVRNTGGSTLRDVVTAAVVPGLHALVCAPVAQGGTLAAGATTVCSGSRTSDQSDLHKGGRTVSASAAALTPSGTGVTATSTTRAVVAGPPPKAVDDAVTIAYGTASVVLAGSTNDTPGEAGGAAIDPSRTEFREPGQSSTGPGLPVWDGDHGLFSPLPDGSIRYTPFTDESAGPPSGWTEDVVYRTYDVAGRSADAKLHVTVLRGPVGAPDTVTLLQGDEGVAAPLRNDRPGPLPGGDVAPLDPSTLRLTADQPDGTADVSASGDTLTIPFVGTFRVAGATVVLDPLPAWTGSVTVGYSVTDSASRTARSTVTFTATPVVPTTVDDTATALYAEVVTLAGTTNDAAGAPGRGVGFGGFVGRDGAGVGLRLVTAEGTWSYPDEDAGPSTRVRFDPAEGFSGVATASYTAQTERGGTAVGHLSVTVRRGGSSRPAVVKTTRDVDVTFDPTPYAVAPQHRDGTAGGFAAGRTTFPVSGQPADATVSQDAKSIALPGRGTVRIAADGTITFDPLPTSAGYAGRVRYLLQSDDPGLTGGDGGGVVGTLALLVTSDAPVATDDVATTSVGRPVTLPGATDDDRGTATTTPLTTSFPSAGQPAGSVLSADRRTLTVPDEGVWTIGSTGTVTFTPVPRFVDGTSPVVYEIRGAGGRTDTATAQVTVAPGAAAVRDALTRPQSAYTLVVDPLANDRPGRDADGTLGALDRTSVRFPVDGQPQGAKVSGDGRYLQVPVPGEQGRVRFGADPTTGLVTLVSLDGFRGTLPTVRYTVASSTTDSTGAVGRQTVSGALQVRLVGRDPVATDDSVTVATGQEAHVAGPSNDVAASADVPIDRYSGTFPVDQVADLPKGSKVDLHSEFSRAWWEATVPGQGYWQLYWSDTVVTFTPEPGFVGTTTPLRYEITDAAGSHADALLTVTVLPPAALKADVATAEQGVDVSVDVAANDSPAKNPDGTTQPVLPRFSSLSDQPAGAELPPDSNVLVVPREGSYVVRPGSGVVTFRPLPSFHGTTSPVVLTIGRNDQQPRSTLRVRVLAVTPHAAPDDVTTRAGVPVRVAVLDNDTPGLASRPLVPAKVRLWTTANLPRGSSVSVDREVRVVAGRGVFAVAGDGTLTFVPAAGASGTLPPVSYDVTDANGTRAVSSVRVTVTR